MSNAVSSGAARPESRYAEVEGVRIHYYDVGGGAGRPLLMIHGAGPGASGWANFHRNAAVLGATRRVIIVDLPGFGRSAKPKLSGELYSYYAQTLFALLDVLGIAEVDLLGNSLGGGISIKMALINQQRLGRIVLMGPAGMPSMLTAQPTAGIRNILEYYGGEGPTRQKLETTLRMMVYDGASLTPELLEERYQSSIEPDTVANWPISRGGPPPLEPLWRNDLSSIKNQTLIVWGRDDRVNTFDMFPMLLSQLQNSSLVVFSRCGHWVQWERPKAFNALVDAFLLGEYDAS